MNAEKNIEKRVESLVSEFNKFSDWEERYKYLIDLGKKMPAMDENHKVAQNLVKGCQSQVWLHAELRDGKLFYQADSDASIVKGLVALLTYVYSDSTPEEVLMTKPTFLETIGLKEHLSMSRANGLNSMIKQISLFALAYKAKMGM